MGGYEYPGKYGTVDVPTILPLKISWIKKGIMKKKTGFSYLTNYFYFHFFNFIKIKKKMHEFFFEIWEKNILSLKLVR